MIYIASPYTHDDPAVREKRYQLALSYTYFLMGGSSPCFSPIVYGHQFSANLPFTFEFWQDLNDRLILASEAVHVLMIEGFAKSRGIKHEIEFADKHGIPVIYIPWGAR